MILESGLWVILGSEERTEEDESSSGSEIDADGDGDI